MRFVAGAGGVRAIFGVRGWAIWSAPRSVRALVVFVDLVAVGSAAAAVSRGSLTKDFVADLLLLIALSIGFEIVTTRVEKLRYRFRVTGHADMTSVWTFAAAIVLPLALVVPLLICIRAYVWFGVQRPAGGRLYRTLYSGCTVWLACVSAHTVMRLFTDNGSLPESYRAMFAIALAVLGYLLANVFLVLAAVWLEGRPEDTPRAWELWQDSLLEVSTLCLAGITALALLYRPWMTVLVLPAMLMLQRSAFTKELQQAATIDSKTGLLNAPTWHQAAKVELERSRRSQSTAALLIIDMDRFKLINDNHGHLAGDAVLKAVADVMTDELRAYDSVGRFGGEEFVALLPRVDALMALTISDRLLQRIRDLEVPIRGPAGSAVRSLTASIGIACYPEQGCEVEDLLHVADAALYTAKREGRDRVEYSYAG